MKTSTSRHANVKHSTGNDEAMSKRTHHRRLRPKPSTGEKARISHFTGRGFGLKREEEVQEDKKTKQKRPEAG